MKIKKYPKLDSCHDNDNYYIWQYSIPLLDADADINNSGVYFS